jgi:hypothetical protein
MLVFLVGAAFLTPISLLLTLYLTRFRYYCAYVGERGIAQFFCSGSRSRITTKILEFTDDLNLHVKTRTIHVPELGGESTYHFRWTDPAGRKVFDVSGNLVSWPPVQSRYHLGTEAEQSWSRYLVAKVLPAIRDGQPYTFKLKARDGICCAKDALELIRKGRVLQLRPEELSQVTMQDGKIFLQEPGASVGWLSSTGVHYISSANLANARAFLLLVEELYGVTPKMRMGKR